jgi:hypothetical protein
MSSSERIIRVTYEPARPKDVMSRVQVTHQPRPEPPAREIVVTYDPRPEPKEIVCVVVTYKPRNQD